MASLVLEFTAFNVLHIDIERRARHNIKSNNGFSNWEVLNLRHTRSWEVVHGHIDRCLKVWQVKPEQTILPTLLPWMDRGFEDLTYIRTASEEGILLWINLTTAGIVPQMKRNFLVSLLTSLLTAKHGNSAAVVIHANRATEAKSLRAHFLCVFQRISAFAA